MVIDSPSQSLILECLRMANDGQPLIKQSIRLSKTNEHPLADVMRASPSAQGCPPGKPIYHLVYLGSFGLFNELFVNYLWDANRIIDSACRVMKRVEEKSTVEDGR